MFLHSGRKFKKKIRGRYYILNKADETIELTTTEQNEKVLPNAT